MQSLSYQWPGSGALPKEVFLADFSFFHCAGPAKICMEGQGSLRLKLFANVAESSRQVAPAGSAPHRLEMLVGAFCCVWHLFPRCGGGGGVAGCHWPHVLRFITQARPSSCQRRLLGIHVPQTLAGNIQSPGSEETQQHHLQVISSYTCTCLFGAQFITTALPFLPLVEQ